MPKLFLCCLLIISLLSLSATAHAASYRGFKLVQDEQCVPIQDEVLNALPSEWLKYKGFIKICALKKNMTAKSGVYIISIWSHDYLDALKKETWENFPLTILVDNNYRQCGRFPELYPRSYVNSLYVSYGKWKGNIPTEIRIDVTDPTVTGDYHYAPLLWDDKDKQYRLISSEPISGKRPR